MNLELVRRWIRSVVGYRSSVYRSAAYLLNQYQILRSEGWQTMHQLRKIAETGEIETILNLRNLFYPIVVRPRTDDVHSVVNNAIREEYGQLTSTFAPRLIIDAGAYIGDTSAYFLSRFPASRVIALEPNQDSFPLASRNLKPYGDRVSLLKVALWSEATTVHFGGVQTGATISSSGIEVPTTTIPLLMDNFGLDFIDLLKMDIEGAEFQVIPTGVGSWLGKVGTILLETHGREIEAALIPLLSQNGFSCKRFRNVWYCDRAHG